MSEAVFANIEERFSEPDNIEIIREQIGGILSLEMQKQYAMALEDDDAAAEDFNATIFVENDEPLIAVGEDKPVFPIVNVSLVKCGRADKDASASVNYRKMKAVLNIDCYQIGNYDGKFAGRKAVVKAWKLARCVRRIFDSDYYTYLKLRGVVSGTEIESMTSGVPNMADSAVKVSIVRIVFNVTFDQTVPVCSGEPMEILPVKISDGNGVCVVDILEETL